MHIFLNVFGIIFIVSVIGVVVIDGTNVKKDDYISQESRELPHENKEQKQRINEVVDDESKEYGNGHDENRTQRNIESVTVTEQSALLEATTITSSPKLTGVSSKPFCGGKAISSSEEDVCKTTLVNYPYSVSIQKKGSHYASGALINARSVLTAAGAFYHVRETIKLFRVRLGSVDCKTGGVVIPIQRVEYHPTYQHKNPAFDVALIKMAQPVRLTEFIKPIPLSTVKNGLISAKFMTTYWPRLLVNGTVLPKTAKERVKPYSMRVSTQTLIPWKTCAEMMRARGTRLDETSLCLKPIATHHSICMPDVGAPVVAEDGLWGVTSGWTSRLCTTYPSPTLVTRIAMPPVRIWLKSVL